MLCISLNLNLTIHVTYGRTPRNVGVYSSYKKLLYDDDWKILPVLKVSLFILEQDVNKGG